MDQIYDKLMKTQAYIKQYGQGPYAQHNIELIEYSSKIQIEQMQRDDYYENVVSNWLTRNGVQHERQEMIPVLTEGGQLVQHNYIADIVVGNIVVEIDGSSHKNKRDKDYIRDQNMRKSGYETIRLETDELDDWSLQDTLGFLIEADRMEKELCSKYCHGTYSEYNRSKIEYVMNLYRKLTSAFDNNQWFIQNLLKSWGYTSQIYAPIPIVSEDGMLEHLYLGYLTFKKFIIEVDPIDKQYPTEKRDKEIEQLGYRVIRIPELGLSEETVADHVCPVIYH